MGGNRHGRLFKSRQDVLMNIRNDAAVGAWGYENNWMDVTEATSDLRFWEMVDED